MYTVSLRLKVNQEDRQYIYLKHTEYARDLALYYKQVKTLELKDTKAAIDYL